MRVQKLFNGDGLRKLPPFHFLEELLIDAGKSDTGDTVKSARLGLSICG